MDARLNQLLPGAVAKVNLLLDCSLGIALLFVLSGTANGLTNEAGILAAVHVCCWTVATSITRLYSPITPRNLLDSLGLAALDVSGLAACLWAASYALDRFMAPTTFDPMAFAVAFAAVVVAGSLLRGRLVKMDAPEESVLIVGTGPVGIATYKRLAASNVQPVRVLGFVSLAGQPATMPHVDVPVLGSSRELLSILSDFPVSEVYVAVNLGRHGTEVQRIVSLCESIGVPFALPTHLIHMRRAKLVNEALAADGFLHYLTIPNKPIQHAVKRMLDIVISFTALVVLSPLLVLCSILIKTTSRGPLFFKQVRVGLHGTKFHLVKFRSMVMDAEQQRESLQDQNEVSGPVFKIRKDPRVTTVGRFLRKHSIDELPQLINVLRGDMTIVGPRPPLPDEVAQYRAWQRRRLSVRPGLTCYWQVSGRNDLSFDQWIALDLEYVDHWNVGVDLRLMLQTVPVVLYGQGAS